MRAGNLRTRLSILDAGVEVGKIWADVRPPIDGGEPSGLRESAKTKVIIRPRSGIRPGTILVGKSYPMVVDATGDNMELRKDLYLTCTRLIGEDATYRTASGTEHSVLARATVNTPYVGLSGQLMDFRYRIEVPVYQVPSPWALGDQITIGAQTYTLIGPAEDGDDGIVMAFTA